MIQDRQAALTAKLKELEAELKDRNDALPAHSVRPHQLIEIEDLEDEIAQVRAELERLRAGA